jgi:hypothetical protein
MDSGAHAHSAITLHNPGRLRKRGKRWNGLVPQRKQTDPVFWIFSKAEWGVRAIACTLLSCQHRQGLTTIRELITCFAAASDADSGELVLAVSQATGEDMNAPVLLKQGDILKGIVMAIIWHANGRQPYSMDLIDHALLLARTN